MVKKEVLTTFDIARMLRVDISTVISWIDGEKLSAYRTPGGHRRVLKNDFLSFLKDFKIPPPGGERGGKNVVLVVEDDPDFRRAVVQLVRAERPEARVEQAPDGFTAGRKVEELKPDLIILDLTLPGLDGFSVCESIRRHPDLAGARVLAVSADNTRERRERILKGGADVFLPKPFGRAELATALDRLLPLPTEAGAPPPLPPENAPSAAPEAPR